MTSGAAVDRVDPPWAVGEKQTLLAFLRYHRATLRMKCAGLTPEQLVQRSAPPSTMCLLGLVRHLSEVEAAWLRARFDGQDVAPLYSTAEQPDADFDVFAADERSVADAWGVFEEQAERADAIIEAADLDAIAQRPTRRGDLPSLRWIMVHLIEEYARHNGHADLLREAIDGATGE